MKAKMGILIIGFILFAFLQVVGSDSYASVSSAEYSEGYGQDAFSPGYLNAALQQARSVANQNAPSNDGLWDKLLDMLSDDPGEEAQQPEEVVTQKAKNPAPVVKQNANSAKAPAIVEDKTKIKLPKELDDFLKGKGAMESLHYETFGLNEGDEVKFEYDANNRITSMKDVNGNSLLCIEYSNKGAISMIYDKKNNYAIEYATEDTCTYYESYAKDVGGSIKYQYATNKTVSTGVLGKVLNIYMTTTKGKVMTGADVGGYYYFADKSPLVPWYSYSLPYVGTYMYNDKIKVQEFRYNPDGSLKNVRYNAWTAGLQDGYYMDGRYAYRIDTYDSSGNMTTGWFNDPSPTRFEPTFTGKVEKDKYNNYYITVKQALDAKGNDVTDSYKGKTYLLTTRFADTTATNYGGQPGKEMFKDQKLETAYLGGAAKFSAMDWAKLHGKSITVQGHLMTSAKSEVGLYLKGKNVGVFSAFDVL